jgi:hypothetical protein
MHAYRQNVLTATLCLDKPESMVDSDDGSTEQEGRDRVLARVDRMVSSGRITEDEAQRLRAAPGPAEFDDVIHDIRARHAAPRLDAAVEHGDMDRNEADGLLERLRSGEHPRGLRARLHQSRPRRRSG